MKTIDKAKYLLAKLTDLDKAYFKDDVSPVNDDSYDLLWFELKKLIETDKTVASYITKAGLPVGHKDEIDVTRKVTHTQFMPSLDKVKIDNIESVRKALVKIQNSTDTDVFIIEPKLDGLSIVFYRRDGKLIAVTRGGGTVGEDVTDRLLELPQLKSLKLTTDEGIVVRGEAFIPVSEDGRRDQALRNMASGAVRSLQENAAVDANVMFIAYEMLDGHEYKFAHDCKLGFMQLYGFDTVPFIECSSIDETIEQIQLLLNDERVWYCDKTGLRLPIDGLVVKSRYKLKTDTVMGHHQPGQLAIKPKSIATTAVIDSVTYQCSSQGKLTPVARFTEPHVLNGQTVQAASLGSWGNMVKLGAYAGSTVVIELANDVIPKIVTVMSDPVHDIPVPDDCVVKGAHLFTDTVQIDVIDNVKRLRNIAKWAAKSVSSKLIDDCLNGDEFVSTADAVKYLINYKNDRDEKKVRVAEAFDRIIHNISIKEIVTYLHIPGLSHASMGKLNAITELIEFISAGDHALPRAVKASHEYRTAKRWSLKRDDDIALLNLICETQV